MSGALLIFIKKNETLKEKKRYYILRGKNIANNPQGFICGLF
jgi:hypothetical protein